MSSTRFRQPSFAYAPRIWVLNVGRVILRRRQIESYAEPRERRRTTSLSRAVSPRPEASCASSAPLMSGGKGGSSARAASRVHPPAASWSLSHIGVPDRLCLISLKYMATIRHSSRRNSFSFSRREGNLDVPKAPVSGTQPITNGEVVVQAEAAAELLPLVYDELHRLAAVFRMHERLDHTLQTTALIHEAYLRLVRSPGRGWVSRTDFVAAAARAVRRVLIDYARSAAREKRGGLALRRDGRVLDSLAAPGPDLDLVELDEALEQLARIDERKASVVELRFFGGLSECEVAEHLGVSLRAVQSDWRVARAWLHRRLADENGTIT